MIASTLWQAQARNWPTKPCRVWLTDRSLLLRHRWSLHSDLDGRNDARSWDTYNSVLDAWRHGDYAARFPGGEDCAGLAARLRAAFTAMTGPADDQVLAVAHGANIRAALPLLAAVPDPGQDLPTAGTARFVTSPGDAGIRLCLLSWAS